MRYTKELQKKVCEKIKQGFSIAECSEMFNIPFSIIAKWTKQDLSEQKLKFTALRKYQPEVSESEARIINQLSECFRNDLSDRMFDDLSKNVSKELYGLVEKVIKQERRIDFGKEEQDSSEMISEIVTKWTNNPFIKNYKL